MSYTPREAEVLREYRLIDEKNEPVMVLLERPEENPLGFGPKLDVEAIRKLIAVDTTPDQRWLDWIFCQAAGGSRAKDATARALEQIKERFIDERVNGFQNPDDKRHYAPVQRAEAEARWLAVEPRWREILVSADQDVVDHLGVFGYYRSWPGKDRIYERVAVAVRKFLRFGTKLAQMNRELLEQAVEPIKTGPADYASLDELEKVNRRIERYFASKTARDDVRVEVIFENGLVRAVCPLTYAASVRYGFDNWAFANRGIFEEVLSSDHSFRDAWKQTTQKSVLVYFYWKVPMPSWISRKESTFHRFELTNLALELSKASLKSVDRASLVFHDEENAATLNLEQLTKMISDEPNRPVDPQDEEMPIKRGPNAYSTAEDVGARLASLQEALTAVVDWACRFNAETVQSDVYAGVADEPVAER